MTHGYEEAILAARASRKDQADGRVVPLTDHETTGVAGQGEDLPKLGAWQRLDDPGVNKPHVRRKPGELVEQWLRLIYETLNCPMCEPGRASELLDSHARGQIGDTCRVS